jgi:CHAT domain
MVAGVEDMRGRKVGGTMRGHELSHRPHAWTSRTAAMSAMSSCRRPHHACEENNAWAAARCQGLGLRPSAPPALAGGVPLFALRAGLILTPPARATIEDDGYLSASEIAGLRLGADWVILSACNTAARRAIGAEALSGLTRASYAQAPGVARIALGGGFAGHP